MLVLSIDYFQIFIIAVPTAIDAAHDMLLLLQLLPLSITGYQDAVDASKATS